MRLLNLVMFWAGSLGLVATAMATGETVLVAGAAGKTGVPLVKTLSEQGYKVRAMVRDRGKAPDFGAGVEIVEADVTLPDTLGPALKGADFVISAIGAGSTQPPNNAENVDYRGVANLADAARSAGVKHFVLMSSVGAGDDNPEAVLNKMFGMVLMWKGKGEEHLRQSGVPYTIVRPGGLMDCEPGKSGLKIAPGAEPVRGAVCRADVALVMTNALGNNDAAGKTIALIGDKEAPVTQWKKAWAAIARD